MVGAEDKVDGVQSHYKNITIGVVFNVFEFRLFVTHHKLRCAFAVYLGIKYAILQVIIERF